MHVQLPLRPVLLGNVYDPTFGDDRWALLCLCAWQYGTHPHVALRTPAMPSPNASLPVLSQP